ncbi:hypothetical protein N9080_05395, partial [Akkermansiaceae bacterium]|nr:hypothetical protein [Akkermansiaceae bacterium]
RAFTLRKNQTPLSARIKQSTYPESAPQGVAEGVSLHDSSNPDSVKGEKDNTISSQPATTTAN